MTDAQLERLIKSLSSQKEDHDLLTEINAIVKLNQKNFLDYSVRASQDIAENTKSIKAAHRRIDYVFTGVILTIVLAAIAFMQ